MVYYIAQSRVRKAGKGCEWEGWKKQVTRMTVLPYGLAGSSVDASHLCSTYVCFLSIGTIPFNNIMCLPKLTTGLDVPVWYLLI